MGKIIEIERNYEGEFHHNLWSILRREVLWAGIEKKGSLS